MTPIGCAVDGPCMCIDDSQKFGEMHAIKVEKVTTPVEASDGSVHRMHLTGKHDAVVNSSQGEM